MLDIFSDFTYITQKRYKNRGHISCTSRLITNFRLIIFSNFRFHGNREYNFTHAQTGPFEPTDTNIYKWGRVDDVIDCNFFLKIRQRVSELSDPEKWHFLLT